MSLLTRFRWVLPCLVAACGSTSVHSDLMDDGGVRRSTGGRADDSGLAAGGTHTTPTHGAGGVTPGAGGLGDGGSFGTGSFFGTGSVFGGDGGFFGTGGVVIIGTGGIPESGGAAGASAGSFGSGGRL